MDKIKKIYINNLEIGHVWFDEETEWNAYIKATDMEYDFIEHYEWAIKLVVDANEVAFAEYLEAKNAQH